MKQSHIESLQLAQKRKKGSIWTAATFLPRALLYTHMARAKPP